MISETMKLSPLHSLPEKDAYAIFDLTKGTFLFHRTPKSISRHNLRGRKLIVYQSVCRKGYCVTKIRREYLWENIMNWQRRL